MRPCPQEVRSIQDRNTLLKITHPGAISEDMRWKVYLNAVEDAKRVFSVVNLYLKSAVVDGGQ